MAFADAFIASYVVPEPGKKAVVAAALEKRVAALNKPYPGLGLEARGEELHVTVPDVYHVGHEAHFAQVARQFFEYLKDPSALPAWEKPNMLAKYYVCTKGVDLSREAGASA
jgi:hypothetical protein